MISISCKKRQNILYYDRPFTKDLNALRLPVGVLDNIAEEHTFIILINWWRNVGL